jgi:hypothetical protein
MRRAVPSSPVLAGLSVLALAVFLLWVPPVSAAPKPPPKPTPQPTSTPGASPTTSDSSQAGGAVWVQNFDVTELWSGPNAGAVSFGWLRKFSYLRVERWEGDRLYVFNPRSNNFAYVDGSAVGPSGPPPADYLEPLKVLASVNLPGRVVGTTGLYVEPAADDTLWERTIGHNASVFVADEVKGDGGSWYRLDSGEFISGDHVRLPGPPAARYPGKWIDANLTEPTLVTAYEGASPIRAALAIHGVAAWTTPVGTFSIIRRVPNETMSSEGLGIPRNAPGGYYVQNVLFTQYFTGDGASLHYNYWSGNFGFAGSHGCLGLNYDDALWFWNWADYGTPIVIHY